MTENLAHTCAGCGALYRETFIVGNAAQIMERRARAQTVFRCGADGNGKVYTVGAGMEIDTWPHMWCSRMQERMETA